MILCTYFNKVVIHLGKILLDDAEHWAVMSSYFSFLFVVGVTLVTAKKQHRCWKARARTRTHEKTKRTIL